MQTNALSFSRSQSVFTDDETICLFDTRYLDQKRPLIRTKQLGGGVWRIKWHPYSPERILIGAMHGGCRIVNFGGGCFAAEIPASSETNVNTGSFEEALRSGGMGCKNAKSFTEHESMAYGADWLVCPHPTQNGYFEAAARYVTCHLLCLLVSLLQCPH